MLCKGIEAQSASSSLRLFIPLTASAAESAPTAALEAILRISSSLFPR